MADRDPIEGELTRPIIGIENRTAQEVFDIMADRFRHRLATTPAAGEVENTLQRLRDWLEVEDDEIARGLLMCAIDGITSLTADLSAAQAELARMEADNFTLSAGQCVVDRGLIGDEHGHFDCVLRTIDRRAPNLCAAFRTTVAESGGNYTMIFRFPTIEAMQAADSEWHALRGRSAGT